MKLSYRARRAWSYVILLVGLPLYVVAAVSIMSSLDRPPWWLELLIYVALGIAWALPLRFVFLGVGREDPDAKGADAPPPPGPPA